MRLEGRLIGEGSGDNVDGTTNIIPTMNMEALRDGYRRILRHIYAPGPYYARIRTFLREYRQPVHRPPVHVQDLMALARSVLRLGVLGRERWHYWRLLLWTQFRRPRLMSEAVTLAIYGYHFRRVAAAHLRAHRPRTT
jgi:hypothetical protein